MTTSLWDRRPFFSEDHEAFRGSVREFLNRDVVANIEAWDEAGIVPREPWLAAGDQGYLGINAPSELGGGDALRDFGFRVAMCEEFARVGATSFASGIAVHTDIVVPYIVDLATPEQAKRWIPGMCTGEIIGAIAMTEPGTGSDLQGIRTTATRTDEGWVLDGAKTFISNGINADIVIVVARTNSDPTAGSKAFSLFVVERGMPGFGRGRNLAKIGLKGQDTAELILEQVFVPHENLLGEVGEGLGYLMSHLPLERAQIAVAACAGARAALTWTIDYVQEREAFGKPLSALQNTQFAIAEMVTELEVTQAYVDDAVRRFNNDDLTAVDAAKAKWWSTEMHKRTVDRCLQLFGGYGYMIEFPIARAFADTRVTTIYGGATEVMKHIIARDVLAQDPLSTEVSTADLVRPVELGAILADALGDEAWREVRPSLITGGKSNLTYLLSSSSGELVLRRPPSGELLASAHDMGREARVQRALAETDVPVPEIRYQDAEGDLLGVPFYVMQKVDGLILDDELPAGYAVDAASRVAIGEALVDTLAQLHAVDPDAVGLGDYGRPVGFVERQIRRWRAQWDASKTTDLADLDRLGAWLSDSLPALQDNAIVHGDFRLDNCLMDANDPSCVAGVLDWELSTLGDPMTDLGMLLFYWREEGEPAPAITPALSRLPGFPGRDALAARYAERSGRSLDDLAFYEAFAHFKFAIIAQGISARVAAGSMAGQDFGDLDDEIRRIVADGLAVRGVPA